MYLVRCIPFTLFYNSSDLTMSHLIYKTRDFKMSAQLFFCEFKNYLSLVFDISQLDLEQNDLDCLFDVYEAYLDSQSSIYHFVISNYNMINARINLI